MMIIIGFKGSLVSDVRSGADTIGGFNALLNKQRREAGEALVSTVLFDDASEVIHDRIALPRVPELTEKEYFVGGCTALLDAVGGRPSTTCAAVRRRCLRAGSPGSMRMCGGAAGGDRGRVVTKMFCCVCASVGDGMRQDACPRRGIMLE